MGVSWRFTEWRPGQVARRFKGQWRAAIGELIVGYSTRPYEMRNSQHRGDIGLPALWQSDVPILQQVRQQ